jgi:CheY-like chemotaxis protein
MAIPNDATGGGVICRVLIIEDHPATLALLTDLLADAGYAVTGTDSGLGAVALARQVQPCAIILDLGLPYRSGVALLEDLKADPETATIPVVVVSALTEVLPATRAELAAAVLPKPFDTPTLLDAIRSACA